MYYHTYDSTEGLRIAFTLYFPDSNPLGSSSVASLLVSLMLMIATRENKLTVPDRRRQVLMAAPLLLILLSCFFYRGILYPLQSARSFPDADDYTGGMIALAFALGFGLRCLRLDDYLSWFSGIGACLACGSILILEATNLALAGIPGIVATGIAEWLPVALMYGFWLGSSVVAYIIVTKSSIPRRRWRLGLCVDCGYDLHGNASGVCPECGRAEI